MCLLNFRTCLPLVIKATDKIQLLSVLQNKPVCSGAITKVSSAGSTVHTSELLASATQFFFGPRGANEQQSANRKAEMKENGKKRGLALRRAGDMQVGRPLSTIYAFSPICTIGQLHMTLEKERLHSFVDRLHVIHVALLEGLFWIKSCEAFSDNARGTNSSYKKDNI